ncbi:hypothetical protein HU200_028954 [Digitaria exilis]|uniref:Uncharacterized protein n=1 Tax=Digitaria exilis TaxID=1010633 RepID=A0A835ES89_9POAL|nr:hypothetical protein HU200_028954 [Digitaria exilis]
MGIPNSGSTSDNEDILNPPCTSAGLHREGSCLVRRWRFAEVRVRRVFVPEVGRHGAAGHGATTGLLRRRHQGLHIGRLCSTPSTSSKARTPRSRPFGYHELAGTKVTLKKPLVVLMKKNVSGGIARDQEPPVVVELKVIGIIRHKNTRSSSRTAPTPSFQNQQVSNQGEDRAARASRKLTRFLGTVSSN